VARVILDAILVLVLGGALECTTNTMDTNLFGGVARAVAAVVNGLPRLATRVYNHSAPMNNMRLNAS